MKQILFILLIMVGISSVMISSCKKAGSPSTNNTTTTNPFTGTTWTHTFSGATFSLTFQSATAYAFLYNGVANESGTYSVANSVIVFNPGTGQCTGTPGAYTYSITGTTMTLILNSDNCAGRSAGLPGSWAKQ